MAFNVLFRGLVCHLTDEKVAVFIAAHGHQLRLVVKKTDVVSSKGFGKDSLYKPTNGASPDKFFNFQVAGRKLRISGVQSATISRSANFKSDVPSLKKGSPCSDLNADVKQRKLISRVNGYLEIPGGLYSVETHFKKKASFGGGTNRCIARTVKLSLTTNGGNVTIAEGTTRKVVLGPNARITFINIIPGDLNGQPNGHFGHYYETILRNCASTTSPQHNGVSCPLGKDQDEFAGAGADCSNSSWP